MKTACGGHWKTSHWRALATKRTLSAGQHTIVITGGVPGSVFYGFRVCSSFSQKPWAGNATFGLSPRHFQDVDGIMRAPAEGFRLTTSSTKKPDSALAWYEDFRDNPPIPDSYWTAAFRQLERFGEVMNMRQLVFTHSLRAAASLLGSIQTLPMCI